MLFTGAVQYFSRLEIKHQHNKNLVLSQLLLHINNPNSPPHIQFSLFHQPLFVRIRPICIPTLQSTDHMSQVSLNVLNGRGEKPEVEDQRTRKV